MTKPLRRDAAHNRAKILAAATDVFSEQGLHGSLEEVARRAGVGIATVYNHFGNRETLIAALLPGRLDAIDELATQVAAEADPWRAVTEFLTRLLDSMATDRALVDALTLTDPVMTQLTQTCQRGLAHLADILTRARTAGVIRADVSDADVIHLVHALSLLDTAAGPSARRRSMELVLAGLRAHVTS